MYGILFFNGLRSDFYNPYAIILNSFYCILNSMLYYHIMFIKVIIIRKVYILYINTMLLFFTNNQVPVFCTNYSNFALKQFTLLLP
jgi:hypothetical protein